MNMKLNVKKLSPILYVMSALFILGGIALLAFAVPGAKSVFFGVFITIFSVLCIVLGGIVIFYIFDMRDDDVNFFLYDRKLGGNIRPDSLTFERINSRMVYFMTRLSSSLAETWQENALASNEGGTFGHEDVYKPLVAYKMLYDLAELDKPEVWRLFNTANPETIDSLCGVFEDIGETSMAQTLREAYETAEGPDDTAWVRDFLTGNTNYLRRRMTDYVKNNLEWFY